MRYVLVSALILCALVAQALPQALASSQGGTSAAPAGTGKRKIPCKTTENAATCYWTHGRLSFYNGDPSYRIWKVGTKRILGVFSGPSRFPPRGNDDIFYPKFPPEIERVFRPPNDRIFADFEICPLEQEKKGEMQAVCIESAKNIFVQK